MGIPKKNAPTRTMNHGAGSGAEPPDGYPWSDPDSVDGAQYVWTLGVEKLGSVAAVKHRDHRGFPRYFHSCKYGLCA